MSNEPIATVTKIDNGILVTYADVHQVKDHVHALPDGTKAYLDAALAMMKQQAKGDEWDPANQELSKKIQLAEKAAAEQSSQVPSHWEVRTVTTFCADQIAVLTAITVAITAFDRIADLVKSGVVPAPHYVGGLRGFPA